MGDATNSWSGSHQGQNFVRWAVLEICRDVLVEVVDDCTIRLNDLSHLLRVSSVWQEIGGRGTEPAYVEEVRIHEQTDQGHRIIWLIQNI